MAPSPDLVWKSMPNSGQFGQITPRYDPRIIQLAVRPASKSENFEQLRTASGTDFLISGTSCQLLRMDFHLDQTLL
jgi:hypothetical protein